MNSKASSPARWRTTIEMSSTYWPLCVMLSPRKTTRCAPARRLPGRTAFAEAAGFGAAAVGELDAAFEPLVARGCVQPDITRTRTETKQRNLQVITGRVAARTVPNIAAKP